mgnify:FL=1
MKQKIKNGFRNTFLGLFLSWIVFALLFDITMICIHFTNEDLETKISNEIAWKIDGTFKNDPNNIWYEGPSK